MSYLHDFMLSKESEEAGFAGAAKPVGDFTPKKQPAPKKMKADSGLPSTLSNGLETLKKGPWSASVSEVAKMAQQAVAPHPMDQMMENFKANPKSGQGDFEKLVGRLGVSRQNFTGGLSPEQLAGSVQAVQSDPRAAMNAAAWHAAQKKSPYGRFDVKNRMAFQKLFPQAMKHVRTDVQARRDAWNKVLQRRMPKVYSKTYPEQQPQQAPQKPAPAEQSQQEQQVPLPRQDGVPAVPGLQQQPNISALQQPDSPGMENSIKMSAMKKILSGGLQQALPSFEHTLPLKVRDAIQVALNAANGKRLVPLPKGTNHLPVGKDIGPAEARLRAQAAETFGKKSSLLDGVMGYLRDER